MTSVGALIVTVIVGCAVCAAVVITLFVFGLAFMTAACFSLSSLTMKRL